MSTLKPVLLLAGGRPRNPQTFNPLFQEVFKASGKASPTVAYVGAASEENRAFFLMMAAMLKGVGSGKIKMVALISAKADIKKAQDILESSDIVYISGGDVEHGMRVVQEKKLLISWSGFTGRASRFSGYPPGVLC